MEMVIKKFQDLTSIELYEILRARGEVFVVGQKILYNDADGKDYSSWHLMLKEENKIIGYLRIIQAGVSYKSVSIGRVLVIESERKRQLGRKILKGAIDYIKNQLKEKEIIISAQFYLKKFYESLGFVAITEMYIEEGIEHIKMKLEL
ncbi:GNAT family N-acetyltransferase [Fusobacterium sp. IOR10]|uniref:GNAT family N-acetyltransferase n=1 Tax=Fusobacterium sp. IOR10 TaxID=2665157 RepID=UPI0013CFB4D4|nr:GNAT family N-acetyltransferase [Fusobacterium sp. IOR10]